MKMSWEEFVKQHDGLMVVLEASGVTVEDAVRIMKDSLWDHLINKTDHSDYCLDTVIEGEE